MKQTLSNNKRKAAKAKNQPRAWLRWRKKAMSTNPLPEDIWVEVSHILRANEQLKTLVNLCASHSTLLAAGQGVLLGGECNWSSAPTATILSSGKEVILGNFDHVWGYPSRALRVMPALSCMTPRTHLIRHLRVTTEHVNHKAPLMDYITEACPSLERLEYVVHPDSAYIDGTRILQGLSKLQSLQTLDVILPRCSKQDTYLICKAVATFGLSNFKKLTLDVVPVVELSEGVMDPGTGVRWQMSDDFCLDQLDLIAPTPEVASLIATVPVGVRKMVVHCKSVASLRVPLDFSAIIANFGKIRQLQSVKIVECLEDLFSWMCPGFTREEDFTYANLDTHLNAGISQMPNLCDFEYAAKISKKVRTKLGYYYYCKDYLNFDRIDLARSGATSYVLPGDITRTADVMATKAIKRTTEGLQVEEKGWVELESVLEETALLHRNQRRGSLYYGPG